MRKAWIEEQQVRLMGFEILRSCVMKRGEWSVGPDEITERTTTNRELCSQIIQRLGRDPKIKQKFYNAE